MRGTESLAEEDGSQDWFKESDMWRSLALAVGLSLCAFGAEFMVVERLVLARESDTVSSYADSYLSSDYLAAGDLGSVQQSSPYGRRVFVPPEWAPWGLLSAGVLTVLYGATLPGREGE